MDVNLLAPLIALATGIIGTYVASVVKFQQDLKSEYDKDLREKRIAEYLKLWRITGRFPKYGRQERGWQEPQTLADELRDWYFAGGGLYLTDASRDSYFALQESVKGVLNGRTQRMDDELPSVTYEEIRAKASSLRTSLVRDVGTRKEPQITA